jgi:hypothetical protein
MRHHTKPCKNLQGVTDAVGARSDQWIVAMGATGPMEGIDLAFARHRPSPEPI